MAWEKLRYPNTRGEYPIEALFSVVGSLRGDFSMGILISLRYKRHKNFCYVH